MRRSLLSLAGLICCAVATVSVRAADAPPAAPPSDVDLAFFENKIRPLLVERCYQCHSHEKKKDKGGLYVDSREALLSGGDNGASLVPGSPEKSKLIEAVGYKNVDLQMPPKAKLSDAEIADLTEWVKRGAPWPAEHGKTAVKPSSDFDLARRKAEHWSWQPVKPSTPPAVKNEAWPTTSSPASSAVDRFILAKLEAKNLSPAAQADKRTLIRRASLMLTGLPPTVDEVDAFLADESAAAFETVVDRQLASPRFGERWARHWLDLVRYAETRGHEFDDPAPLAFQYRDYVIRAFNADVPYDQFVREHVAGDLLPKPRLDSAGVTNESILATGFWHLGEWIHSPVDIRQDEAERVDNQVDTFGKAFLAVTLGCARCHDHKFDAIPTKDFYALAGFMHSSGYREVRFQNVEHNRAVMDRVRAIDADAAKELRSLVAGVTKQRTANLAQYLLAAAQQVRPANDPPADGATARDLDPVLVAGWAEELKSARKSAEHPLHGFALAVHAAESTDVGRKKAMQQAVAAQPPEPAGARTIVAYHRSSPADWMSDGEAFGPAPVNAGALLAGPPSGTGRAVLAVLPRGVAAAVAPGQAVDGLLRTPTFVIDKPWLSFRVWGVGEAFIVIDSHRHIKGPLHGVSKQGIKSDAGWRTQSANLGGYIGQRAHIEFRPAGDPNAKLLVAWAQLSDGQPTPDASQAFLPAIGARLATSVLERDEPCSLAGIAGEYERFFRVAADNLDDADNESSPLSLSVADWIATGRGERFPIDGKAADAILAKRDSVRRQALRDLKPSATAIAMLDGSPFDERVLIRGSHKTPGDVVPRRFMEAIDGPAGMKIEHGSGRLQLADRLVSLDNPLTSRVMANRIWHHLFGRGIVASTDNFGVLGDQPTHPELLDHLASEFVKDGWSVKRLIRRLVLTKTWQMSSRAEGEAETIDPQNLLWHRANLRRLEAEAIRDQMLLISGRLDERMFGPSVDVHLTSFMDGRGRPGRSGPLDGAGRRSIYTAVRRNFLPPMMLAFDTPQPFSTMGKRSVSNVPAQALILMNDPFVVEQARLWAKRTLADPSLAMPADRIDRMYRQAFGRSPTDAEREAASQFLAKQAGEYGLPAEKAATDGKVWGDLAHVLMNVKEFVFVP